MFDAAYDAFSFLQRRWHVKRDGDCSPQSRGSRPLTYANFLSNTAYFWRSNWRGNAKWAVSDIPDSEVCCLNFSLYEVQDLRYLWPSRVRSFLLVFGGLQVIQHFSRTRSESISWIRMYGSYKYSSHQVQFLGSCYSNNNVDQQGSISIKISRSYGWLQRVLYHESYI